METFVNLLSDIKPEVVTGHKTFAIYQNFMLFLLYLCKNAMPACTVLQKKTVHVHSPDFLPEHDLMNHLFH